MVTSVGTKSIGWWPPSNVAFVSRTKSVRKLDMPQHPAVTSGNHLRSDGTQVLPRTTKLVTLLDSTAVSLMRRATKPVRIPIRSHCPWRVVAGTETYTFRKYR